MTKTPSDKALAILFETEKVADKILMNQRAILELSQKKEDAREAIRELEKSDQEKAWITVAALLVKVPRAKALEMLKRGKQKISSFYFTALAYLGLPYYLSLFQSNPKPLRAF